MNKNVHQITIDGWRYEIEIMDSTHLRYKALGNTSGFNFMPMPWATPLHVAQLSHGCTGWIPALKAADLMDARGFLTYHETNHFGATRRHMVAA